MKRRKRKTISYYREKVRQLLLTIEASENFQRMPVKTVRAARELRIRDNYGFVDVCCYAHGQVPQPGEFGRDLKYRYVSTPL